MKRKEVEGREDNPFTRRKCNPRMVTKSNAAASDPVIDPEVLKELALKDEQNKLSSAPAAATQKPEAAAAVPAAAAENGGKAAKKDGGKEDLFDAHDFDIEIDVDMSTASSSNVSAAAAAPVKSATALDGAGGGSAAAVAGRGPAKRALNLSDYKTKRGLI